MKQKTYKVLLIGPAGMGKTEFRRRITAGGDEPYQFDGSYKATIGTDFSTWGLPNKKATLQVWDTSGQERFQQMSESFYKGTDIICVVWDGTKPIDKAELEKWVERAKKNEPKAEIRLVVNKAGERGSLGRDELRKQIDEFYPNSGENPFKKIHFCSAKTGKGIDDLRNSLVAFWNTLEKKLLEEDTSEEENIVVSSDSSGGNTLFGLIEAFRKPVLRLLGTSNAVRNSFLLGVLGVAGMVVLGALGGPLSVGLFSGLMVLAGSVAALGAASTLLCTVFAWISYAEKFLEGNEDSLSGKFAEWIKTHPVGFGVGVALFLGGIALTVMAIAFPGVLAGLAFLAAPISFVAGSLSGIGLVGTPAAVMAVGMLTVAAITVWDGLCRIGNALFFDEGAPLKRVSYVQLEVAGREDSRDKTTREPPQNNDNPTFGPVIRSVPTASTTTGVGNKSTEADSSPSKPSHTPGSG